MARVSTGRTAIYAVLIVSALISMLPFVYMLLTAFKSYGDVVNNTQWPWPPLGTETPWSSTISATILSLSSRTGDFTYDCRTPDTNAVCRSSL